MKKDDTVYLRHILDAIELIEEYTEGMSENEFLSNSMAHDAVIRQIEIIGEAARNISDEFQMLNPDLPWGKMIGIRNKIIHEYFNVNFAIVWDTVQEDLPALQKIITSMLE
jgi:uncharacterized protein with HEPN domain